MLSLILMLLLITSIAWFIANLLSTVVYRLSKRKTAGSSIGLLWASAWIPLLLPMLTIAAMLMISLGKSWGLIDDHCLHHTLHHPHFCFFHLSAAGFNWLHSILIGFIFVVVMKVTIKLNHFNRQRLESNRILNLSRSNKILTTFKSSGFVAFTLGILKPKVFVSEAIERQLTKREQRIIIAHESNHIRNKDTLKNYLLDFLLIFHMSPSHLKNEIRLHMEIQADKKLTKKFSRFEVAQLLVKLARFNFNHTHASNFTGSEVESRIRQLLDPSSESHKNALLAKLTYALLLLFPFFILINHHAVETFAGWFF